ncbi:MAG TPA: hypothetical protein VEI57_05875 [Nitrospirota bacterium]|nr:hypothetical protein [Nitrospirota bacterium]
MASSQAINYLVYTPSKTMMECQREKKHQVWLILPARGGKPGNKSVKIFLIQAVSRGSKKVTISDNNSIIAENFIWK